MEQKVKTEDIGALWEHVSPRGVRYLTGRVGGITVVVFENKSGGEKNRPHWRVFDKSTLDARSPRPTRPIAPSDDEIGF